MGLVVPVTLCALPEEVGVQTAVYPVIAAPPSLDGAVKATSMNPLPRVRETKVGAPGTVELLPPPLLPPPLLPPPLLPPPLLPPPLLPPPSATGVAETAFEGGPEPTAFLATTRHEYDTPLVRPVTTTGLAEAVAETALPVVGVQVPVYNSIAEPPLLVGAKKDRVNRPLDATIDKFLGAPGTVAGGLGAEGTVFPGATTAAAVLVKIVR
jgi:hypothetical protein